MGKECGKSCGKKKEGKEGRLKHLSDIEKKQYCESVYGKMTPEQLKAEKKELKLRIEEGDDPEIMQEHLCELLDCHPELCDDEDV